MASHPRRKHLVCVECGRKPTELEPLSRRGLHNRCALKRMSESAAQMEAKSGPYYEEWLRSMAHASRRLADQYSG